MPTVLEHETFREWSRQYGITHFRFMTRACSFIEWYAGSDIIYTNLFGQSIVVIDKYETAVELLDKRSGIYSSKCVSFVPHFFSRVSRLTHTVGLSFRCLNLYLGGVTVLFSCLMVT